jgi:predicted nucleotidyltransferase
MSSDIKFLAKIIGKYIDTSKYRVFIFGSRATNTASKYSDYDIGIEGARLAPEIIFNLEAELENSDFPYNVDLVEFSDLSDSFKKIAKEKTIPIE